jgi:hypothetical protein
MSCPCEATPDEKTKIEEVIGIIDLGRGSASLAGLQASCRTAVAVAAAAPLTMPLDVVPYTRAAPPPLPHDELSADGIPLMFAGSSSDSSESESECVSEPVIAALTELNVSFLEPKFRSTAAEDAPDSPCPSTICQRERKSKKLASHLATTTPVCTPRRKARSKNTCAVTPKAPMKNDDDDDELLEEALKANPIPAGGGGQGRAVDEGLERGGKKRRGKKSFVARVIKSKVKAQKGKKGKKGKTGKKVRKVNGSTKGKAPSFFRLVGKRPPCELYTPQKTASLRPVCTFVSNP